ncbi:MAG: hypothetical protein ACI9JN_002698 [Bacteroidia bacterium]|jgi:hypothetical protein
MRLLCLLITCLIYGNTQAQKSVVKFHTENIQALTSFSERMDTLLLLKFYNHCIKNYDHTFLADIRFDNDKALSMAIHLGEMNLANSFLVYKIKTGLTLASIKYLRKNDNNGLFF